MRRLFLLLPLLAASCTALTYKNGTVYLEGEQVGYFSYEILSNVSFTDCVSEDDGLLKITRTYIALEDIDSVRLCLDFVHSSASSFSMIPSGISVPRVPRTRLTSIVTGTGADILGITG